MKINRFLPLIVPLAQLALLEAYFARPRWLYMALLAVFLLYFFTIRQFILASRRQDRWFDYFILPATLTGGTAAFSSLLTAGWLIHLLFVLCAIFSHIYLKTIYLYLVKPEKYRRESLENISAYVNFLNVYFIASAIYGFQVFLGLPTGNLMLALLVLVGAIAYQVFWANGIYSRERMIFILLIALVMVELAWAASFLTLSYYVLGLILAVSYYILIGLSRFYLKGMMSARIIKAYLVLGFSSIILVLLTANWLSYG